MRGTPDRFTKSVKDFCLLHHQDKRYEVPGIFNQSPGFQVNYPLPLPGYQGLSFH
jgi:hypothetical protein